SIRRLHYPRLEGTEQGSGFTLEDKPQRELHHARIAGETLNRAERAVADVRIRQPELDGVEQVEDFPPQLDRRLTRDREPPLQRRVDVEQPRSAQDITARVAERARRHGLE